MAFSLGQAVPQEANWWYSSLGGGATLSWTHPSSTGDFLYKHVHRLSQAELQCSHSQTSHLWSWPDILGFPFSTTELPGARKESWDRWILIFNFLKFLQLLVYPLHHNCLKTMTAFSWAFIHNPLWFIQNCDFKIPLKHVNRIIINRFWQWLPWRNFLNWSDYNIYAKILCISTENSNWFRTHTT